MTVVKMREKKREVEERFQLVRVSEYQLNAARQPPDLPLSATRGAGLCLLSLLLHTSPPPRSGSGTNFETIFRLLWSCASPEYTFVSITPRLRLNSASMARKRPPSRFQSSEPPSKRQATDIVVIDDDSEDDCIAVANIEVRKHVQRTVLKMQRRVLGAQGEPSHSVKRGLNSDPIVIEDDTDDEAMLESDEILARRLAAEWAAEDQVVEPHSQPTQPSSHTTGTSGLYDEIHTVDGCSSQTMPNAKLRTYQNLFTGTRRCTKCKTDIVSPQGYVCISHYVSLYASI